MPKKQQRLDSKTIDSMSARQLRDEMVKIAKKARIDGGAVQRFSNEQLRRIAKSALRQDGWVSALTGAGTLRDKKQYAHFVAPATNWRENIDLWRGDDLAGRIVELLPNEMMREGWDLCIEGANGDKQAKQAVGLLEDFGFNDRLRQALCLERAVGGSGIVMGCQDASGGMENPLDVPTISALKWIETMEPLELQAAEWQNDFEKPGFGRPDLYRFMPVSPGGVRKGVGQLIHVSRILIFPGIVVSRRQVTSQMGWGDAILTRCRETIRDFQGSWGAIGHLITEYGLPVWKIKGLAEIISQNKDDELKDRIEMMSLAMSLVNAVVIDAELESFDRNQIPLTGLSELMDQFATRLAAASDTPVTLLFGISPGGLQSTGSFDTRSWYDRVKSAQENKLKAPIEKAVRIAFHVLGFDEPSDWHIEFRPLWQPTEKEAADARNVQATVDKTYKEMGVLSADEIRQARFSGRKFNFSTHVSGPAPTPAPAPAPAADSPPDPVERQDVG